jgi:hypothetical protein
MLARKINLILLLLCYFNIIKTELFTSKTGGGMERENDHVNMETAADE